MIKKILFAGMFICATFVSYADEPDQAIHDELRSVLKVVATAIDGQSRHDLSTIDLVLAEI